MLPLHPLAGLLYEVGSHLSQLEMYARRLGSMDADSIDFDVGLRMEAISLTLRDEAVLQRIFDHERFHVPLTVLLARTYTILETMYLPSQFMTPNAQGCAKRLAQRINVVLKEYGWPA